MKCIYNFEKEKLRGKDFSYQDLCGSEFFLVNLSRANFEYADLRKSRFYLVNLQSANLKGADLNDVRFFEPHLNYANLCLADLTSAIFHKADFTGADLSNTIIKNATFDNVIFKDTNFFTEIQINDTDSALLAIKRWKEQLHEHEFQDILTEVIMQNFHSLAREWNFPLLKDEEIIKACCGMYEKKDDEKKENSSQGNIFQLFFNKVKRDPKELPSNENKSIFKMDRKN